MELPRRIMTCYGYRFPKSASNRWSHIAGTITLRDAPRYRLVMDLNYRDLPGGEVAVRVAREASGERYEPEDLPPIEPMPRESKKSS